MSTRKGDVNRSRPQKYQNRTAFKNNLHDNSHTTKFINSLQISQVCKHCKEVIEWKIKYKKYKPLKQPKKCTRCFEKAVVHAYHVMCIPCSKKFKTCPKCCQMDDLVSEAVTDEEQQGLDNEMNQTLKTLSERKRRTFLRYMNSTKICTEGNSVVHTKPNKDELITKLNALKLNDDISLNSNDTEFSDGYDNDESSIETDVASN